MRVPSASSVGGDGDRRRPMAKLVYTLLSTQELKRRLKDCHLSATGPRPHLEQRLQEFVHIYNSQCDSLQPKSGEGEEPETLRFFCFVSLQGFASF